MKIDKALIHSYPFTIRPLSEADGGGFAIEYPDLPGVHLRWGNSGSSFEARLSIALIKHGEPVPNPTAASGPWPQSVPRSLHSRLVAKARQEGVSLNTLDHNDGRRRSGPAAGFIIRAVQEGMQPSILKLAIRRLHPFHSGGRQKPKPNGGGTVGRSRSLSRPPLSLRGAA